MAVLVQLSLPNYWVGSSIPDSSIDAAIEQNHTVPIRLDHIKKTTI